MQRNKLNLDIKNCRLCYSKILLKKGDFLSLGNSPSRSQNLAKDKKVAKKQLVELKLYKCNSCGLVQLLNKHSEYYKSSIRSSFVNIFSYKK